MSLIGCVDTLIETCISGWAADQTDLERQVFVDVFVNSVLVATLRAAVFREDLRQAGIGDGGKGFRFDPSPYLRSGRNEVQVRHAGVDLPIERGQGRLSGVHARNPAGAEEHFVAALQAYYEFSPEHRICEIAPGEGQLLRVILEWQLPFRKYTGVELSAERVAKLRESFKRQGVEFLQGEGATVCLPEKADLILSAACPCDSGVLRNLVEHNTTRPAYLALEFNDGDDSAGLIRQTFEECNVPAVRLDCIPSGRSGERRLFVFAEVGAASGAELPPVLAHIHVPKCAGTSFRVLLERHFGPRHSRLYVDDTYFAYSGDAIRNRLLQDPEIRALSSHHVRTFPRWLAGREMFYVTFLRDPVEQFVSYMTHIQKHFSGIASKSLLEAVPPDAPHLSLREFARWLLTQNRDIPFRENHNVNFFARHSSPAAPDRLEAAESALSGLFFVGITERMEESVRKLQALAQAAGLDFPTGPISTENTSSEFRDDLSWINPADEVGSMLLRSVDLDRQLYDWAVARLDEEFWAGHSPRKRLELSAGLA